MALWFVMGTAAELIKVYPLIVEAQKRKIDWFVLSTGQSGQNFWRQYDDFALPRQRATEFLKSSEDLKSSGKAASWFVKVLPKSKKSLLKIIVQSFHRVPNQTDFWVIHGDTFSTLIGATYGRRLGLKVVHIEAGMRSGNIMSPFPEELNRRIVSKLAHYHMAPDEHAAKNLYREGIKKNVVVTNGNTVLDSLHAAIENVEPNQIPKGKYVVTNFHRFENLSANFKWASMIDVAIQAAQSYPVFFVLQPNARHKIDHDLDSKLRLEKAGVKLVDRMPFSQFMHLMHRSEFMISDGGSNQQECFYLGKPCLIMRDRTESIEGIGSTCVISQFKKETINDFLSNPEKFKRAPVIPVKRPTDIIFESLKL